MVYDGEEYSMEWLSEVIRTYILILGVILIIIGTTELVYPMKAFDVWKNWVNKKFFFLHGIILIAGGLPLTVYNGTFSVIIFIIGLLAVLTGPVILIYPEKIRDTFESVSNEWSSKGIEKIIFSEALLRICAGLIFITSYAL